MDDKRPALFFLTCHWLSVLGSSLATVAGCTWLFLLPLGGRTGNPYAGILFVFAIPAIFFAGLALIPVGWYLARRRIQAGLAVAPSRHVTLRRLAIFFTLMTAVNVVIASQVSYRAVEQMETNQFCGQTCHIMKPQFVAHERSGHRGVGCVECHVTPGASGFVHAKMNGTRQLIEVTLNNYPRPVPPALVSNRLASSAETCEQCHARSLDHGSRLRVLAKFKDDEANTPIETVLMMKVGGGSAGGIHGAHMGPGIEIRYTAADKTRLAIPRVEYRNSRTGEATVYSASGAKTATATYLMECADCHNRSGHDFEQPEQAVDGALAAGLIPVGLPFARKTGVQLLKTGDAERIPGAFAAFYKKNYPDVAGKRSTDIDRAGQTLAELYRRNNFAEFKVTWGTYPNDLGHDGCFRCHDGNHSATNKKTIAQDCDTCHQMLAVEETAPKVLKSLGLDQKLAGRLRQ